MYRKCFSTSVRKKLVTVGIRQSGRSGTWSMYWTGLDGKEHTRTTQTQNRETALGMAAGLECMFRQGGFQREFNEWDDLCRSFLVENAQHWRKRSVERFYEAANRFRNETQAVSVDDLNYEQFCNFISRSLERGMSPATIQSDMAGIRHLTRWAGRMGLFADGLTPEYPRVKVKDKVGGRPLRQVELERIIGKARDAMPDCTKKDRWEFYLRGLYLSGLRLSESLALRWSSEGAKIWTEFDLYRRPMICVHPDVNKNGKADVVPMAPEFYEHLMAVPVEDRTSHVFRPVFAHKNLRPDFNYVRSRIGDWGKEAGVITKTRRLPSGGIKTKYASSHDFRRTFGFRMASKVMPLVLAAMMRHSSVHMTFQYYTGRNADDLADAAWEAHDTSV